MRNLFHILSIICSTAAINIPITAQDKDASQYLRDDMPREWAYSPVIEQILPSDDKWWDNFNDSQLDSLIAEGISNNFNVLIAIHRIKMAESQIKQASAAYYPTFSLNAGYTKARNAGAISEHMHSTNSSYFSTTIDMNWEIDLFGKITTRVKGRKAQKNASKAEYVATMVSLASEIATYYINLRTFQEELKVTRDYMESQEKVVKIARARFEAGLVSKLDVVQAEIVYYSTEATIPKLETSLSQSINALAILTGQYPGRLRPRLESMRNQPDYHHLVPSGIPANLLRRRPDIVQAEYELAAYAAAVGVAKKDFLPTLSLNGSIGVAAHDAGDLFKDNSFEYSISPTLSWTLFDGLARKYAVNEAKEQMKIGIDNYNMTVMTAVQEVDNAMVSYTSCLRAIESYEKVLKQSTESFDLSVDLYKQGLTPFTNVVDAQINTLTYANSLIAAKGEALVALINLYKALGGAPETF